MTAREITSLTDEDKVSILRGHLRDKEHSRYADEIYLLEELATATPNQVSIDAIKLRIDDSTRKITVIVAEMEKVLQRLEPEVAN